MVDAQLFQNGGLQIMHVHWIFDNVDFVGEFALTVNRTPKCATPDDKRVLQHATLFEALRSVDPCRGTDEEKRPTKKRCQDFLYRWSVEMGFFFGRPRARSVDSRSRRPPPPILRTLDQPGSLCIAFDVPAENVEMAVILRLGNS